MFAWSYYSIMAERIIALVEKEMLIWARRTASLDVAAASLAAHIPADKIAAWERGEDRPSIPEMKKLANAYKRPMSVFFLPEPPTEFQALRDFRRRDDVQGRYSRALAYEVRAAQERRLIAIDLAEALSDDVPRWDITTTITDDPEVVAGRVREKLGISLDQQSRWGDPAKAFRAWRDSIESHGVLVSVLGGAHHKIPIKEARGFAIAERPFPMIVVNGQDRTNGRIFTLMHELGHVILGESAIENDIEPSEMMPPPIRSIETYCNRIAAGILMPKMAVLAEQSVVGKNARSEWTDVEIAALARRYSVSREALLVRLAELGRIGPDFLQERRAAYAKQYEEIKEESGSGFAPYAIQIVSHLGRGFSRIVLQGYHSQILTLSTASGYLGTQAKHVTNIERATFDTQLN